MRVADSQVGSFYTPLDVISFLYRNIFSTILLFLLKNLHHRFNIRGYVNYFLSIIMLEK